MARDLGFKRIIYGLFMFADFVDMRLSIDQVQIEYQLNEIDYNSFFLIPNMSFLSWASM